MKSTISYSKFLAGLACAGAMSACDSIKNVPEEPFADLPPVTVVLGGVITNLSSVRAITLMNNGDINNTRSFLAGAPSVPNAGESEVPFSFGSIDAGASYNVTVKDQPWGKNCVVNNGSGTATAGVVINIQIACTNNTTEAPRFDLTVNLPAVAPGGFQSIVGAKVRLTNEEEIIERTIAPTDTQVLFPGVLINAGPRTVSGVSIPAQLNAATWTVSATTLEGGTINKCAVSSPTGSNSPTNIATPVVGACKFSIGGRIGYSLPAGVAYPGGGIAINGLQLQLKDPAGNVLDTTPAINCTPGSATVTTGTTTLAAQIPTFPIPSLTGSTAGCSYTFSTLVGSSPVKGLYEVVVATHPAGQRCLVANGGGANVFTLGNTSPQSIDRAHVLCRAIPASNKLVHGIYRLRSSTWTPNIASPAPVTSTWDPFNFTVSNTASSNMMAFFEDGTFLYGSHGLATGAATGGVVVSSGVQVEHGFYDFDSVAGTMRFTLVTDTNNGLIFPATFSPLFSGAQGLTVGKTVNNTQTTTAGISATPNPQRRDNSQSSYMATMTMSGVTFGTKQVIADFNGTTPVLQTVRTITGEFGGAAGGSTWATSGNCGVFNANSNAQGIGPCMIFGTGAGGGTFGNSSSLTTCSAGSPCVIAANGNRLQWDLEEPTSIDTEMTGAWMSEDFRRIWVWDHRTIYGLGVGVIGGHPSMNDACFTLEDLHAHEGIYVRRGSGPGCHPFVQAAQGQSYTHGAPESTDYPSAPGSLASPAFLPGFIGRIPGGTGFPGNTAPSPIQFHIAPAATFFSSANPVYFPERFPDPVNSAPQSLSWCTARRPGETAEILGIRATSHNTPIDYPVYLCRTKVPLP